jgi:SpoVK/Ycf46/Vps4 family AAA+-type ATPase
MKPSFDAWRRGSTVGGSLLPSPLTRVVPLPDVGARLSLIRHLLMSPHSSLSERDLKGVVEATEGYSGSDLHALCKEAALGPLRDPHVNVREVQPGELRGVGKKDFLLAVQRIRPSVSPASIRLLEEWNERFGAKGG